MEEHEGLAYRLEQGEGRPVVFLHGWLGSHHDWDQVRDAVDTDHPWLAYDHRCHGDSADGAYTLTGLVADLRSLVTHCGLDDPIIAGHSMGGTVALQYAAEHPVSGLLVCGGFATEPEPENRSPGEFLELLDVMDRDLWAAEIAANYSPPDTEARALAEQELREADEVAIRSGLELMTGLDIREQVREISAPARVVSGHRDAAITPDKGAEIAELLGCPHHELDATHLMLRERPAEVAGMLRELLDETR